MATRQVVFRPKSAIVVSLALSALAFTTQGCARPDSFRRTEAAVPSSSSDQRLPFHQDSNHISDDSAHPSIPLDPNSSGVAPFQSSPHSRTLPANTLVTVRLEAPLFVAQIRPHDLFTAAIDGPIIIDGETCVDRGAKVTGHIEATQPAQARRGRTPDPSLVRLTLDSIAYNRHTLPLQTSSLFAKGTPLKSSDYRLPKGRRLTFRLTAPVILSDSNSIAVSRTPDLPE